MRVTNNMLSSQLLLNLNRNAQQMNNTQVQMATGRKINKPSDDPVGITYSLRYRAELSSNEQYQKNVDSAVSWLDFNETVLTQAGDVLQRVRELVVQGSTGTNPQSALDSINEEMKQLKEQMVDIANSKLNGKYIFNGETYDTMPYNFPKDTEGRLDTTDAGDIVTDPGKIKFIVGESVQLPINITGNEVFGSATEDDNIFVMFNNIIDSLTDGNQKELSDQLDVIDSRVSKILAYRAEIGAKTNRVELMMSRLDDLGINLTDLQSKVEDADFAELAMQSKIQENIYNASLSTGAKIISPTLVDFLR
ncbi:flagellar hook-associated protein FlgL [Paenibacillus xylanexedens]|uniref:flagellar hook-associated protein FlgL n=1 Tax=Paenibacillus xylanexedens TaxID=528191 RepID=UPI00119DF5F5|nr:flagellar hook-associated protein FlgL [Paenibacillus xylanexedens]